VKDEFMCASIIYRERSRKREREERRGEGRLNKKLRPKAKQFLKK
jgi:hypothetical protein